MHSVFNPASPQARAVAHLWWWMLSAGGAVWVAVVITMLISVRRARVTPGSDGLVASSPDTQRGMERAVSVAAFITILILIGFLALDFSVGRALATRPSEALTIELVGHQWWWEAHYANPDPSKRLTTANEMHIPIGVPVQFRLTSADVIHSFWVPNLAGKRDLIPGYQATQWFVADTAGTYRGQCAEFCGLQHAKMALYIVAEPKEKFAAWLNASGAPLSLPTDATAAYGERVFMSGGCAVCHTIGGTDARATVGPNLSHFKSRSTIAAGTLANTRVNLARWIMNPQLIKPGAQMPPSPLTTVQLNALVAFLETLR